MKISENITLIDGTMANSYVVKYNDKVYLIDSGTRNSASKIIQYFQNENIKPDIVLITHYHPDHVGGLFLIEQKFHPNIYVPDKELDVILGKSKIVPTRSFLSKVVASLSKINPVLSAKPISQFNDESFKILDTPGHTPQSTSYIFEPDKTIFIGDAFMVDKNGNLSINKTFTIDLEKAERSKDLIMNYKGYLIAPGHGSTKLI